MQLHQNDRDEEEEFINEEMIIKEEVKDEDSETETHLSTFSTFDESYFSQASQTDSQDGLPLVAHETDLFPVPLCPTLDDKVIQSSTGQILCMEDWPGDYNFGVFVDIPSPTQKGLLFSALLKKIYVDIKHSIPLQIKIDLALKSKLFVRAVPVYTVKEHMHLPVKRCPNHLKEDEDGGQLNIHHVVQCKNEGSSYQYDDGSKRYSVVVPLEDPQPGSDVTTLLFSVTCKGSCAGGMNRRPVAIIFTLERDDGQVVGRHSLKIRVCSCPKRDMRKEEKEYGVNISGQLIQPDVLKKRMKPKKQASDMHDQPLSKKKKIHSSPSSDDLDDSEVYTIKIVGTRTCKKILKHAILLKTFDWDKTKSVQDQMMKEEYEEQLEKLCKRSSS